MDFGTRTSEWQAGEPQATARILVRAAEYVRMSTEHQKYSTENQSEAIRAYARALLAATTKDQLVKSDSPKLKGLTEEQMALMEREASNLEREFKIAEQSYGTDHLDLVLAKGYLAKLLRSTRAVRFLTNHHQEILNEFRKIAEVESATA